MKIVKIMNKHTRLQFKVKHVNLISIPFIYYNTSNSIKPILLYIESIDNYSIISSRRNLIVYNTCQTNSFNSHKCGQCQIQQSIFIHLFKLSSTIETKLQTTSSNQWFFYSVSMSVLFVQCIQ